MRKNTKKIKTNRAELPILNIPRHYQGKILFLWIIILCYLYKSTVILKPTTGLGSSHSKFFLVELLFEI